MKPTIYAIALIVLVMTAMWSAAAVKMEQPAEVKYAPVELTQAMYDAIRPGMTVEEVVEIVGCEATDKEPATAKNGAYTERLYWKDSNGSSIYIRTDGKILTDKIAGFIKP